MRGVAQMTQLRLGATALTADQCGRRAAACQPDRDAGQPSSRDGTRPAAEAELRAACNDGAAMPPSALSERVAAVAESLVGRLPDQLDRDVRQLLVRLREPMRIAVVGWVKAGRSTVVNALRGRRVAPTDVSECTRLATLFRYGYPQRIALELRDGTTVETQLARSGLLPGSLPVTVRRILAERAPRLAACPIVPVSALLAQRAGSLPTAVAEQVRAESGFAELEHVLVDQVAAQRGRAEGRRPRAGRAHPPCRARARARHEDRGPRVARRGRAGARRGAGAPHTAEHRARRMAADPAGGVAPARARPRRGGDPRHRALAGEGLSLLGGIAAGTAAGGTGRR